MYKQDSWNLKRILRWTICR